MIKKICSLLMATTMLVGAGGVLTVNAAENEKTSHTPNVSALTLKTDKTVSRFYNDEGEEVDLSGLNTSTFLRRRVALPSKFDLRDEGRSTSVKDQGGYGFCWSFASTASMESNILTQNPGVATGDEVDLSESGGAWFSCNSVKDPTDSTFGDYRNDPYNGTAGGNALDAAESISSGYGAYPEELAKYQDVSGGYSEALRYYSDYKFKDFSFFSEDFNLIKQRLMEKGALYYTYKSFEENYYETEDGKWTYSDNGKSLYGEETEGGHAVTIIGWDDTFSKSSFHPDAGVKNDGAWLCKNSWGEEWGNDGYFWVSYESFAYEFGQFEMQDKESFDTIHQHQTSSEQFLFGGDDEENPQYFSSANVFTAKTREQLKQICYTNAVNSNVKAKIFKLNKDYKSPVDGTLLAEFDSNVDSFGTHCLDVPGNITFNEGDIFSVVIEGEALMTNFRYEDAENPTGDKAGKSYFSDNGTDWTDVADFSDASYAAIKAYTTKTTVDKTELENLVKAVEAYKPANEIEQDLYDTYYSDLKAFTENAEELLADDNATNTDIKNMCCVLKAKWDAIKTEIFSINNLDDFKTFYESVRSGKFNNKHVELNTDLDLSGFNVSKSDDDEQSMDVMPSFLNTSGNLYFNGKGHTIKNLNSNKNIANLFGNLENSMVKNLNIENCNAEGEILCAGLLAGIAVDTQFININVKNSTVNAPRVSYVALLAGLTNGCTFMDCTAENCKIIGQSRVGLFFSAEDEASSSQAINCKAENYTMYSYRCVDDNMGFICASPAELTGAVSIKVTDDECIIRQFIVKVDSLKVNGNEIIPDGLEYHIDKSNGPALLDIEFSFYESYDFSAFHNVENQTVEITGYEGTDKDIVIPEKVYGFDVVGLRGGFETYGMNNADINSVTLPGVVKSIPDECFSEFSGLTKITLESGVEEIGNSAFENCEQLSEINLADSIKTIGEKAFFNCGAKSVTLGKNIEAIGDYAFGYSATETGGAAIEGFTIYGYSGTAAETYAKANGFNFVDLSL